VGAAILNSVNLTFDIEEGDLDAVQFDELSTA
jgi:hypothetical protein